jgi:hypothetical protein
MTHEPDLGSPAGGALRASDADREHTAAALRRHHLDGRLDTDELQERLGRCYAARTHADLAALTADLPPEQPAARATAPPRPRRHPGAPLLVALVVAVALAATLAAVHHGHPGPLPLLAVFLLLRLGRGSRRGLTAGGTRV